MLDRDDLASRVREQHWTRCDEAPLLPGVRERLEEARHLGLGTAVASSSPSAWIDPWLDRHDLIGLIDVVCTRDHVRRVKPAPDLFLLAAERLAVPPSACIVFEDSPNGLRAAHAAGMHAVAVPNRLTRELELPLPCLRLDSLAERSLVEIMRQVEK
jgi:HAD superfamily hydrolase (TIGR01509 family)